MTDLVWTIHDAVTELSHSAVPLAHDSSSHQPVFCFTSKNANLAAAEKSASPFRFISYMVLKLEYLEFRSRISQQLSMMEWFPISLEVLYVFVFVVDFLISLKGAVVPGSTV